MKLIIDIDEELYEAYKGKPPMLGDAGMDMIAQAIANGMPLPKGHGRLVDENYVIAELVYRKHLLADDVTCGQVTEIFDSAVVVDADKESNNEIDN